MIDKRDYYHGAALFKLLDDNRCRLARKDTLDGYEIADDCVVFLKYTTKPRTPWAFNINKDDFDRWTVAVETYCRVFVGFICASDGVCALYCAEIAEVLGRVPGRLAISRKHNGSYSVWGPKGEMKNKVPQNRWPNIIGERLAKHK